MQIAISAGELSGDEHAAKFVRALLAIDPSFTFWGMGGGNMRAAGVETLVDSEKSASVMGFFPVFRALGRIRSSFNQLKLALENQRPDALVLVDYPDFNLRLARVAKRLNIKTFYFIPPKVWAWRRGRVSNFISDIDRAACIFPFEDTFFREHGYSGSAFVGHPFVDELNSRPPTDAERASLCAELDISPSSRIVAVLPGSRTSEVHRLLPLANEAAKILSQQRPDVACVMAVAPSLSREHIRALLPLNSPLRISNRSALELMRCSRVGLLKSGTSNLQAAFLGLPFVMFYQASAMAAFIVRTIVRVKEYSPVNILRPGTVPEIIQEQLTAQKLAQAVGELLDSITSCAAQQSGFHQIIEALKYRPTVARALRGDTAYARAAGLLMELL